MGNSLDSLNEREEVHITLNSLGYFDDESQKYVAHCLELNLVATGKSHKEAMSDLIDIIEAHLRFADENDNWDNMFFPAPPEIWARFYNLSKETKTIKRHVRFGSLGRLIEQAPPLDVQFAYG